MLFSLSPPSHFLVISLRLVIFYLSPLFILSLFDLLFPVSLHFVIINLSSLNISVSLSLTLVIILCLSSPLLSSTLFLNFNEGKYDPYIFIHLYKENVSRCLRFIDRRRFVNSNESGKLDGLINIGNSEPSLMAICINNSSP